MRIYLVQHGKSYSEEIDPERSLTPEGIKEVERNARIAFESGLCVDEILHSGKTRAKQTAEIFAKILSISHRVRQIEGIAPKDDVKKFADKILTLDKKLVVGHLPFLQKLVSFLIQGDTEKMVVEFIYGGIVGLLFDPNEKKWKIKGAILPDFGNL